MSGVPYVISSARASADDAVWFVSARGESGFGPHYVVCTGRYVNGQRDGYAFLLHDTFDCAPHDEAMRQLAIQRALTCHDWLAVQMASKTPVGKWPDPPHDFTVLWSGSKDIAPFFRHQISPMLPDEVGEVTLTVVRHLKTVWPEWMAPVAVEA